MFLFLLNSSGAIILFVYLLICLSQLRMRRTIPPEQLRVKMWVYPVLTVLTALAIVAVLVQMFIREGTRSQLLLSLLAWAVVLVAYAVNRRAIGDAHLTDTGIAAETHADDWMHEHGPAAELEVDAVVGEGPLDPPSSGASRGGLSQRGHVVRRRDPGGGARAGRERRGLTAPGALLARSTGEPVVVSTVVTTTWPADPRRIDAEHGLTSRGSPTRPSSRRGPGWPRTWTRPSWYSPPGRCRPVCRSSPSNTGPGDRPGVVIRCGLRPRRARQRQRPDRAQLAHSGRHCAARVRCGPDSQVHRVTTAFGGYLYGV